MVTSDSNPRFTEHARPAHCEQASPPRPRAPRIEALARFLLRLTAGVLLLFVAACAGTLPTAQPATFAAKASADGCPSVQGDEPFWIEFRKSYPYHIQGTAYEERSTDGCSTLVVAEPPPAVTLDELAQILGVPASDLHVREHTIGHDGFTKDVVFRFQPVSSTA